MIADAAFTPVARRYRQNDIHTTDQGAGMAEGKDGKDAVARALGWFSVALGAAQVAAPRGVARMIGVGTGDGHANVMRAAGLRELATGAGILARPRPAAWLWARVLGDALDLALLTRAKTERRPRVVAAMAAVAGVAVPDVVESVRLSRARGGDAVHVRKSVTINRPRDEIYEFWRRLENLPRFMSHLESVEETDERRSRWRARGPAGKTVEWDAEIVDDRPGELIAWRSLPGATVENSGKVRFVPAPGGRGTEVHVELRYSPPGGAAGAAVAKLLGEEPSVQTHDDLRRFKQVIETGDVVRSEGSTRGGTLAQHVKQRPAQPVGADGGSR